MLEKIAVISRSTHSGCADFPYNIHFLNAAVLMLGRQYFMHSCGHILCELHSASGLQEKP